MNGIAGTIEGCSSLLEFMCKLYSFLIQNAPMDST